MNNDFGQPQTMVVLGAVPISPDDHQETLCRARPHVILAGRNQDLLDAAQTRLATSAPPRATPCSLTRWT